MASRLLPLKVLLLSRMAMVNLTMARHALFLQLLLLSAACAWLDMGAACQNSTSSILVSSVGRPRFSFEVYMARIGNPEQKFNDQRLTNGSSVNFNGQFVADSEAENIMSAMVAQAGTSVCTSPLMKCKLLVYVSEDEQGAPKLYVTALHADMPENAQIAAGRKLVDIKPSTSCQQDSCNCNSPSPFFQDRPSVANGKIFFVGMREPCRARQSWTAIFSARLLNSSKYEEPRCLTVPTDVADFSPSVSPSGKWVLVASDQDLGFQGEVCAINSDLYIFRAEDGLDRHLLIRNGGWPSWGATDSKFYFHRFATDGWWSVYVASIVWSSGVPIAAMDEKRLTLPGFNAFTPAASKDGKWLAMATRRPGDKHRHIEILDLNSGEMRSLTKTINAHHYNPFVDPDDSTRIGYHRCSEEHEGRPELEALSSSEENVKIHRIAGDFPSFSKDGSDYIAFTLDVNSRNPNEKGVYVMKRDGSNKTVVFAPKHGRAFGTSWGTEQVVYTSYGEDVFMADNARVHIIAIHIYAYPEKPKVVRLTKDLQWSSPHNNNAFPSASPDGKWIVFRSSRASQGKGHHNLYVMDSKNGEFNGGKVVRLTNGPWTDTMCVWSPDGQWIAFASDREKPGSRRYVVYKMRWNESEVKKVMESNSEQDNAILQVTKVSPYPSALHPNFSPDSKRLVFTTDYAGYSAEPISMPNMFQPFGEVYMCEMDDCSNTLQRMTWSPYETALPTWDRGSVTQNAATLFAQNCSKGPCDFNDGLSLAGGKDKIAQFCDLKTFFPSRPPSHNPEFHKEMDALPTPEHQRMDKLLHQEYKCEEKSLDQNTCTPPSHHVSM